MKRIRISIRGIVQGVGFRPFIYSLARSFGIRGYVKNTSGGVLIEAEGGELGGFTDAIRKKLPPLARIDSIELQELPFRGYEDFVIVVSAESGGFTLVSPDTAVCEDCLKELFDPSDRRYLYPFINCTNCGPRYSITKGVPYDRPNTTMAAFSLCPLCREEYDDPADRRFHAQPNACPLCGPQVELKVQNAKFGSPGGDPLPATIELLRQGAIVAVKGIGGFHLCCDAMHEEAAARLRAGKRKNNKPFALMAPDAEIIRRFCEVSGEEEALLNDMRRPIVLLKKKGDALPEGIAPNNAYLGFMLPYTPLHHLLFLHPAARRCFDVLVMTSGNLSEEPIVIDNDDALQRLSGIADAFLLHNRDIFMRADDSVVKVSRTSQVASPKLHDKESGDSSLATHALSLSFIRRARGFTPEPIRLRSSGPDVLGCGADVKNTFTITRGDYAIVSQHIGDMENLETLRFFEEALRNLKQVYRSHPVALAYDLHPGYLSSRRALEQSRQAGIRSYGIQHHYAHIASVMAEHGIREKVIGIALDGTGYGVDGNLWGSEFLVCDLEGFRRAAHFRSIPLPGGEGAIRECWRTAVSYLADSVGAEKVREHAAALGFPGKYGSDRIDTLLKIRQAGRFSPLSSGAGRLFDAVAALTGICDENTFEGEAAMALEAALPSGSSPETYPFEVSGGEPLVAGFSPMVRAIVDDMRAGVDKGKISLRFHATVVRVIRELALCISRASGIRTVALSGGVFQNAYVLESSFHELLSSGFEVYTNEAVPCNDACISLGQAYVARERIKKG